jgi:eukaryotic-like serine/threonine-protein kinase
MAYEQLANSTPQVEDIEELVLDEFLTELPSDGEHEQPIFADLDPAPAQRATPLGTTEPPPSSVFRSQKARPLPPSRREARAPSAYGSAAPNGSSPSTGDVVASKYHVEQVLGRSGSEVTLLARHIDLDALVVLHVLSPHAAQSTETVSQFQRAARHALEHNSEHLERVIDYGRLDNGCPYRVAELPRGPALSEVLEARGPLPMAEAVDTLLAACEAVAEFHCLHKVHGQLSTNILFVERSVDNVLRVRLVDFGAAESLETEVLRGRELALPGTSAMTHALPGIAPECIRNPASVDHRADVWTLGAILYEMLAGRPAFRASGPLALLAMIAADEPEPLTTWRPEVPETLARTVNACLQKEPWLRPQTAVDLITLLMPFASRSARAAASRSVLAQPKRRESLRDNNVFRREFRLDTSPPAVSSSASAATLLGHAAPSVSEIASAARSSSAPAVTFEDSHLWHSQSAPSHSVPSRSVRTLAAWERDPWRDDTLREPPLPHSYPRPHARASQRSYSSAEWSAPAPVLLAPRAIAAEFYGPAPQRARGAGSKRPSRAPKVEPSKIGVTTLGRVMGLLACVMLASVSAAGLTRLVLRESGAQRAQGAPFTSVDSAPSRVLAGTAPNQPPLQNNTPFAADPTRHRPAASLMPLNASVAAPAHFSPPAAQLSPPAQASLPARTPSAPLALQNQARSPTRPLFDDIE